MKKILLLILTSAMVFLLFTSLSIVSALSIEEKFDSLKEKSIFSGYDDGLPHLEDQMTREQAAKIITLIFNLNISEPSSEQTFSDVPIDRWSHQYIETAVNNGIVNGMGNNEFAPTDHVSYEQFAKMIVIGYSHVTNEEIPEEKLSDDNNVSDWAKKYISSALNWGLIEETENYRSYANRAFLVEATYIIERKLSDNVIVEPVVSSSEGNYSGSTTSDRTETNNNDGSESNTDDGSESNTDDGSESNTDDGSESNTGDGSESNTGDGSESNTDDGSESNTDDGSESNTGDGSESNTDDGSESNTGDGSESNTGDGSESNTGDGSESNTGDGSESNTGDESESMVLAYYTQYGSQDKSSLKALKTYHNYMNAISIATFGISNLGEIEGNYPTDALDFAKDNKINTYATIGNHDSSGFSSQLASEVLNDSNKRTRAVNNIEALVKNYNFSGVNLDFENMYYYDRAIYTQFVDELAKRLQPQGYEVIVSVTAKTYDDLDAAWSGAFDYAALGEIVDYVQLMSYDQHGTWGEPGPVSGYDWLQNVFNYADSQIPSEKIIIGIPGYAIDWDLSGTSNNIAISQKEVTRRFSEGGITVNRDSNSRTPYYEYTDNAGNQHVVWYDDDISISEKVGLVNDYNFAGVSVWEIDYGNENFWKAIEKGLENN
ncbi:glycosyl hydrolase family 18 protein [Chengkuizengella sp. SCS-71B]|uniref:glycosyl hydrolase family 18 protein n=1 Tax=Chengkuizengella sp. SCS-71B TaxID=3115290 RepID=UPI0032C2320F